MHTVQLFDTPESVAQSAGEFLAEGAHAGATLLVAARRRNWPAIEAALDARGCPATALVNDHRLVVLDAESLLEEISRNGMPQRDRFDASVGALVVRLASPGPLRIYGEMVEVMAEQEHFEGALRLEGFWNELGERCPFDLLCGYSAAHFAADGGGAVLRRVCSAHQHSGATPEDPLGGWLLTFPTPAG